MSGLTYHRDPRTLGSIVLEFGTVVLLKSPCSGGTVEVNARVVGECRSLVLCGGAARKGGRW